MLRAKAPAAFNQTFGQSGKSTLDPLQRRKVITDLSTVVEQFTKAIRGEGSPARVPTAPIPSDDLFLKEFSCQLNALSQLLSEMRDFKG